MGVIVPVLVSADTIYQREDHNKRLLMFGRPGVGQYYPLQFQSQPLSVQLSGDPWLEQVHRPASPEAAIYPFRQINVQQPAGQSLFFLTPKRPPPEFFFDRFASVYSVTEIDSQTEASFVNSSQPYLAYAQAKRPGNAFFEDHSLETGQTNHPYPHVTKIEIGLFPYSFEVPDLNDNPWLELVHRPPNPEAAIYPFRQIYQTVPGQPYSLIAWRSRNWPLEPEPIWRVPDTTTLNSFRQITVVPPPPLPTTCVNEWSADGRLNWTADGYPGWSADGYEPTPLECAVTYFAEVGVNVGTLTYQCSNDGVPLGWVITGYVPYINVAYAGQYIPLTISNGPCVGSTPLTVPNVVGLFYYDAQLAILDAGFLIGPPIWALSGTVLPQYVISQSIPAGTLVSNQTQILITVSGFPVINQPGIITPVP